MLLGAKGSASAKGGKGKPVGKVPVKAARPAKEPVKSASVKTPKSSTPAVLHKKATSKVVTIPEAPPAPVKGKQEVKKTAKKSVAAVAAPRAPRAARFYMETGTLLLGNPDGGCREIACENQATTAGYCRGHYIKNWKKIKHKEQILREGRLNQYLEELILKYPDKYIDAIRQDLGSEKEFAKVITDLDLDETSDDFDMDQEPMESIIDSVKREFEDETETF